MENYNENEMSNDNETHSDNEYLYESDSNNNLFENKSELNIDINEMLTLFIKDNKRSFHFLDDLYDDSEAISDACDYENINDYYIFIWKDISWMKNTHSNGIVISIAKTFDEAISNIVRRICISIQQNKKRKNMICSFGSYEGNEGEFKKSMMNYIRNTKYTKMSCRNFSCFF